MIFVSKGSQFGRILMTYVGVEHVTCEENARNVDNVVGSTTNTSGEGPETDSGCLSNDNPGGRRGSEGEKNRHDETQRRLGKRCSV